MIWSGADSQVSSVWLAGPLTYLTHSLLTALVVAALMRVRGLRPATQNLCWKLALLAPLVTALLSVFLGSRHWHTHTSYVGDLTLLSSSPVPARHALPQLASAFQTLDVHASLLLGLVLGCTALGLLRFLGSAFFLRYRLRERARVVEPELLERLDRLEQRMGLRGIRLTESTELCSPLVLGTNEICVPCPLPSGLSGVELDSVLAHELAHLERLDGTWFLVIGAVQSLLWLNPLNHWLASCFRESAELASDDRALEVTGDPLGLARALLRVATSASFGHRLVTTPLMARSKKALLPRVSRLINGSAVPAACVRDRGRLGAMAALSVLTVTLGTVSVQVARANPLSTSPGRAYGSSAVVGPALAPTPDIPEQSARMTELAVREARIRAELAAAQSQAALQADGSAESVRVLELDQELRHLREQQAWLEAQFVTEWQASASASRSRDK